MSYETEKNASTSVIDRENDAKSADRLKVFTESKELSDRMSKIKHKIMVLSGKGGVGKSTVTTNVAVALALEGKRVGILDSDFHGPSIPTLLNIENLRPSSDGESIVPVDFAHGIKVMSMGFLLPNRDDAIIWRGPMKMNVLKQLLTEIKWGELDYLIVDFPPGTGDEPLSVAQLIPECDGAIIVTTPQDLSLNDVRKCINFCRQVNVPVVGVLENMSGLVCPNCNTVIEIFKAGGGEKMAKEMEVPFLGRIPLDPQIVEASDSGKPFVYHHSKTEAAKVFIEAVQTIMNTAEKEKAVSDPVIFSKNAEGICKIAVPVVEGHLSAHFGHCDEFVFFDVDLARGEIVGEVKATPPPHEPGVLPAWLGEMGANLIIAGGMGTRAQDLFKQKGIEVLIGASSEEPLKIIDSFINGTFTGGQNICDH